MEKRNIICTCCPVGCHMQVTIEDKKVTEVVGNTCKRGAAYALDEITDPKRTVTSTVKTDIGAMLSVKTSKAVSLDKIAEVMKQLSKVVVKTPVKIGDIVIEDVCSLKADVVATKNIP